MDNRGRAYRIFKDAVKYFRRLKNHYYYYDIRDERDPRGWRKARDCKELDEKGEKVKLYKKTTKTYKSGWEAVDKRRKVKKRREDLKKDVNDLFNELKE